MIKKTVLLALVIASRFCLAQDNAVPAADTTGKSRIVSDSSYLYYAFLSPSNILNRDTVFLENDVYIYINRSNGALFYMKPDQGPFPIPKAYYSNPAQFIFDNFLGDDKFGILKRMASMKGLLKNASIGIDVAIHQSANKEIDWSLVKKDTLYASIGFVIMRATLGYSVSFDSKFSNYYDNAKKAGYPIGLYHNFVMNKRHRPDYLAHTREQANKFVTSFKNRTIDFKPILDIEDHWKFGVNDSSFTSAQIREATSEFIRIVKAGLNTDVIIYSYEGFYNKHLKGYYDDNFIWIAKYPHTPEFGERKIFPGSKQPFLGISYDFTRQEFNYTLKNKAIGWQYSDSGIVKGISGNVDMNIILQSDYQKWLK
jgi:GH25 family lysozyme M1 (1,4-beta-N-acetylmuramidase)